MKRAAEYNKMDNLATYGMTPVSDRFPEEILSYVPHTHEQTTDSSEPLHLTDVSLPESYNASEEGIVPPVRDQGQCGSCWAFSAMATLSVSDAKLNHKAPVNYSEQQLVDCSTAYPNDGCGGGNYEVAFTYLKSNGAMLDEDYSYKAVKGKCAYVSSKAVTYVNKSGSLYKYGSVASVSDMKAAIYKYGIISVSLDSSKLQSYRSGIVAASGCSTTAVDHGVNIIGWGKQGSTEYWIGRNSWGPTWGEKGYFRIVAGSNACAIEKYPAYAYPKVNGDSSSSSAALAIPSCVLLLLACLLFL